MVNLDEKDLKILFYLSENSRISLTSLGKHLDMSPAAITYRMNKLMENKVIKNFTININSSVLTPNYQAYLVQGNIKSTNIDGTIAVFQELNIFDNFFILASEQNFIGNTFPIPNKRLKFLLDQIQEQGFQNFTITPILNQKIGNIQKEIFAENISSVYCPLCQKTLEGDAVVAQVGNQIMGFCCQECKDLFEKEYDQIAS